MHRCRRLKFTIIVTLLLFMMALAAPPIASAEENCRTDSGEPTDPQRIFDWLDEAGFDLEVLGINVSMTIETLLNALRALGIVPPEEPGS
jgi:hypothetical protein